MKNGKITQCGKYTELLNSGADFIELVGAHKKALSALDSLDGTTVSNEISTMEQYLNVTGMHGFKEEASKDEQHGETDNTNEPKGQLVEEEEREKGKVEFSVYWKFITTAYGGALVPFILLAQILFEGLQIGSNYWMACGTPISTDVEPPVEGTTLIVVYVSLAFGSSFCILARALLLVTAGYKTATILFNKMHFCIFRAPMSFFDSTPSGRILNRVCIPPFFAVFIMFFKDMNFVYIIVCCLLFLLFSCRLQRIRVHWIQTFLIRLHHLPSL